MSSYEFYVYQYSHYSYEFMYMCAYEFLRFLINQMFSIIFEGKTYYDFENNRIRTEWRINCNYPGPDEFCSLKCENEYDYR